MDNDTDKAKDKDNKVMALICEHCLLLIGHMRETPALVLPNGGDTIANLRVHSCGNVTEAIDITDSRYKQCIANIKGRRYGIC